MALSQYQIITSLSDAMKWFEKELQWGVNAGELRHLSGRIGELYVAMITNGQMAVDTNQKGYDVVSKIGERISVKTTTMSPVGPGHVTFNPKTLSHADRVIVVWLNATECEIEILLDKSMQDFLKLIPKQHDGKINLPLSALKPRVRPVKAAAIIRSAMYKSFIINELESGSIQILENNKDQMALPILREIAAEMNLPLINGSGNFLNTRQLGSNVITHLIKKK